MKGGENMAVMLNVFIADPKQNAVLQNVNTKTGAKNSKTDKGFAATLTMETDKSGLDADAKTKSDDGMQLIAAMAGMMLPMNGNQLTVKPDVEGSVDNSVEATGAAQVKLTDLTPGALQTSVAEVLPVGASQANIAEIVSNGNLQVKATAIMPIGVLQAKAVESMPAGILQIKAAESVPAGILQAKAVEESVPASILQVKAADAGILQAKVAEVVPASTSEVNPAVIIPDAALQAKAAGIMPNDLSNTVAAGMIPNNLLQAKVTEVGVVQVKATEIESNDISQVKTGEEVPSDNVKTGLAVVSTNDFQSQLTNMIATTMQVSSQQVANGTQVQPQLQNFQHVGQTQVIDFYKKNTDVLTDNPVLVSVIPSVDAIGNTNSSVKISNKPIDSKKITFGQVNLDTTTEADNHEGVNGVGVNPVLKPQAVVAIATDLSDEQKGTSSLEFGSAKLLTEDTLTSDHTAKNAADFASVLNQQGINSENQSKVLEVKQGSLHPIPEPNNIVSQIVDQVRLVTKPQNTEMIIQLKPEHLGELTFKVTIENGVVSASFHSNNAEVRGIIESSLTQLKQDLANQGLKVDNVGVYAGLGQFFSNGQQSGGNQQPGLKMQEKKKAGDFLEVFEVNEPIDQVSNTSGVDYRA